MFNSFNNRDKLAKASSANFKIHWSDLHENVPNVFLIQSVASTYSFFCPTTVIQNLHVSTCSSHNKHTIQFIPNKHKTKVNAHDPKIIGILIKLICVSRRRWLCISQHCRGISTVVQKRVYAKSVCIWSARWKQSTANSYLSSIDIQIWSIAHKAWQLAACRWAGEAFG